MTIACFGDSLTLGSIGHSYIKYIDKPNKLLNKGINGDTTICMYNRLKRYIEHSYHSNTDTFIIEIGTNDLLLPYLATVSPLWKIQITPRIKF